MPDIIDELKGLDDAALLKKFGFADKISKFKADLEEAAKLPEKGREHIARNLEKAFQPSSYIVEDVGWQVEREQRKAAKLEAEATDFVNECGCCEQID